MQPIIIIGSGLAGYTLAKEFRKLAPEVPLHIITQDDGAFYSKPMLSNALAKGKTAATLATSSAEQMAAQLHATVWSHTPVTAVDTVAHTVIARGETLVYDKLVLAIGAEPIRPPLSGDATMVHSVNNLTDYARFRERIEHASRIAVIGPGLIGCEFANDLIQAVKTVSRRPAHGGWPRRAGRFVRTKRWLGGAGQVPEWAAPLASVLAAHRQRGGDSDTTGVGHRAARQTDCRAPEFPTSLGHLCAR